MPQLENMWTKYLYREATQSQLTTANIAIRKLEVEQGAGEE